MAQLSPWVSAAASDIGKVRRVNEDAYLDQPERGLWAVADGMGGHYGGDEASRQVVSALAELVPSVTLEGLTRAIRGGLDRVNKALVASGVAAHHITGATVVVLCTHGPRGACLWAGDSRAYRLRAGQLTRLTTDHSQAEMYVRLGLLSREEATNHPYSNVLTRAIGTQDELSLETTLLDLKAGDRYLLCSDGLYRHLDDEELRLELGTGEVAAIARRLVDRTLERGALDNVTAVVVEWQRGRYKKNKLDDTHPHPRTPYDGQLRGSGHSGAQ